MVFTLILYGIMKMCNTLTRRFLIFLAGHKLDVFFHTLSAIGSISDFSGF
jgi:hypothetical protein